MAVLFRTEEVKTAIPTASKRYALELMKEANANREAHAAAGHELLNAGFYGIFIAGIGMNHIPLCAVRHPGPLKRRTR